MKSAKVCCWTGFKRSRLAKQPALGRGAVELRAADVGRVEHALHGVLGAGQEPAQVPPVPAQLAELHQLLVGDESQRALAARQPHGDVERIVPVGLAPLAAPVGQLRGVGDVDPLDARPEAIDEPLHERAGLHGQVHRAAAAPRSQSSILPALFVLILSRAIFSPRRIDGGERDGALVQVNSHKRLKRAATWQNSPCTGPKGQSNYGEAYQLLQAPTRFYAGRAAGRDRDHRHSGRAVAAGDSSGPRSGADEWAVPTI